MRGENETGRGSIVRDGLSTDAAGAVAALADKDEAEGEADDWTVWWVDDEAKMLR